MQDDFFQDDDDDARVDVLDDENDAFSNGRAEENGGDEGEDEDELEEETAAEKRLRLGKNGEGRAHIDLGEIDGSQEKKKQLTINNKQTKKQKQKQQK